MVRIFKTIDGAIHEIQEPQEGCWIALTNPTATEIFENFRAIWDRGGRFARTFG